MTPFEIIVLSFMGFLWIVSDIFNVCTLFMADRNKLPEELHIWEELSPIRRAVLLAILIAAGPFALGVSIKIYLQSKPETKKEEFHGDTTVEH